MNNMLRDLASRQQEHMHETPENNDLLAQSSLVRKQPQMWLPSAMVFVVVLAMLIGARYFFLNPDASSTDAGASAMSGQAVKTLNYDVQTGVDAKADKTLSDAIEPESTTPKTDKQIATLEQHIEKDTSDNIRNNAGSTFSNDGAETKSDDTGSAASVVQVSSESKSLISENSESVADDRLDNQLLPSKPSQGELSGRINNLLESAARALQQDRLTSPIEDNAYRYFQEVLAISPDNVLAQVGMQRIAQRYVDLAQTALRQGDAARAAVMIKRAEFVLPDYPGISAVQAKFGEDADTVNEQAQLVELTPDAPASVMSPTAQTLASVSVAPIEVVTARTGNQSPSNLMTGNDGAANKEFANEGSANEGSATGITTNAAWLDRNAVAEFEQLLKRGELNKAERFLVDFIASQSQPVNSAQRLFDFYVQQTKYDLAQGLLQEAQSYLPRVEQSRMTAQWLAAQHNYPAAIRVLESDLAAAEKNEAYRALLAGLYHKTARYPESAASYRRLIETFGEKASYWLGLALALDALKQNASALEAYRRVPMMAVLQPAVKDYVEQRIAALSH